MNKGTSYQRVKSYMVRHQPVISLELGKLPPQSIDLEEAVLGALLLEKNALATIIEFLRPEHFYLEAHKFIFQSIVDLFSTASPVDMRTVVDRLRKNGTIELIGGAYYIAELTSKVSSAANIEYHARIIIEMAIKRDLIAIGSSMVASGYEDTTDVFELMDKTEQRLFKVTDQNLRGKALDMSTLMNKTVKVLQERQKHVDGLSGVPSGFSALDRITSGWQKSDLIILAARPGMGKSGLAVTCARNAAIDFQVPVAIFSLEMASEQVVNRLISGEAEIDSEKLKRGTIRDFEWALMINKTKQLTTSPIYIDDSPAISILELRAKARRLKSQNNIGLIIVDYLQLMTGDRNGSREQEIASISRALKGIAKELNIPIIALSQLSRGVENRGGDKRPQLSDLRESGAIEQDADIVMFLYRPEYYKITTGDDGQPTAGKAELIIAKHRNGALENINLRFIGKYTKFLDWDDGYREGSSAGSMGSDSFFAPEAEE